MKKFRIVLQTWKNPTSIEKLLSATKLPMTVKSNWYWDDAEKEYSTVLVEDAHEDALIAELRCVAGLVFEVENGNPVTEDEIDELREELKTLREELSGGGTWAAVRGIRRAIRQIEDALEAHRKGKDAREILNKTYTVASCDW